MRKLLTRRDLDAGDLRALRDLVRFGVMADDQIARRYADPALAYQRLPFLKEAKLVHLWWKSLEGSRCYSATNLAQILARVRDVVPLKNREAHLAHDIAVVDLADFLLGAEPDVEWRTEREGPREGGRWALE